MRRLLIRFVAAAASLILPLSWAATDPDCTDQNALILGALGFNCGTLAQVLRRPSAARASGFSTPADTADQTQELRNRDTSRERRGVGVGVRIVPVRLAFGGSALLEQVQIRVALPRDPGTEVPPQERNIVGGGEALPARDLPAHADAQKLLTVLPEIQIPVAVDPVVDGR